MIYSIYSITCNDKQINNKYIGSTINFRSRCHQHKYHTNNPLSIKYNYVLYKTIRDNGGFDNWTINIIEEINCESKTDARQQEQKYILENNSSLNMCKAYSTIEEKKIYNIMYLRDYRKKFGSLLNEKKRFIRRKKRVLKELLNKIACD